MRGHREEGRASCSDQARALRRGRERSWCARAPTCQAAKVAFQRGAYERASELFLRVGRGDLAAKALERARRRRRRRALSRRVPARQGLRRAEAVGAAREGRRVTRMRETCTASSSASKRRASVYWKVTRLRRSGRDVRRGREILLQPRRERRTSAGAFEDAAPSYFAEAGDAAEARRADSRRRRSLRGGQGLRRERTARTRPSACLQQVDRTTELLREGLRAARRLFQDLKGQHTLSVKKFEEAIGSGPVTKSNVEAFYAMGNACEQSGEYGRRRSRSTRRS